MSVLCWLSSHLVCVLSVVLAAPILIRISRILIMTASHVWRSSRPALLIRTVSMSTRSVNLPSTFVTVLIKRPLIHAAAAAATTAIVTALVCPKKGQAGQEKSVVLPGKCYTKKNYI